MELKIKRQKVDPGAAIYAGYLGIYDRGVADLEEITGSYNGPEGKAEVEIVWNPDTRTYYRISISANAPPILHLLLERYFGITAQPPSGQSLQQGATPLHSGSRNAFPTPSQQALPKSGQKSLPDKLR